MPLLYRSLLLASILCVSAAQAAETAEPPHPNRQMDPAMHQKMMARHMQMLHDKLKLQPQQESAWHDFVEAMKPRKPMPPKEGQDSAPERMEQMMQQQQAEMQQRLDALKIFYGQLTPEQRKVMDNLHRPGGEWQHRGKREASSPHHG